MTDLLPFQENMNSEENDEEDEEDDLLPEDYDGPYKMVFVVNTSLGMGVGKIAAQVSLRCNVMHLSFAVLQH